MIKRLTLYLVLVSFLGSVSAERVPITLGYYPSWSDNWVAENNPGASKLAKMPTSISHIFLAFAKPDLEYIKGSYDISKTGIQFSYDGRTARNVIQALKNKGIQVILSIGGETYWSAGVPRINYQHIADLVRDFGFIGVDWDFEPNGGFSEIGNAANVQHFITFIKETRKVLPKSEGFVIAVAPAGCGALGGSVNDDINSPFKYANRNNLTGETDAHLGNFTKNISLFGFASTGHMIPVFAEVGNDIDIVAYQGYNMGGATNRYLAYQSYAYYANKHGFVVAAGVHVPNEPWGPYFRSNAMTTAEFMKQIMDTVDRQGKGDGMMVWQILATSSYPGESQHSGKSYLNIARNVFNGQSPSEAVSNAFNYPNSNNDTNVVTPDPSNNNNNNSYNTNAAGTSVSNDDGSTQINSPGGEVLPWSSTTIYAVAGIRVTYENKTYENKWYTRNETPGASQVWKDVSPVDSNSSGSQILPWSSTTIYAQPGTKVTYNNKTYENQWYSENEIPGVNQVWKDLSPVDPNSSGNNTNVVTPTPINDNNSANGSTQINSPGGEVLPWSSTTIYAVAGIRVTYENKTYENKWYTRNETPDVSLVWKDVSPVDPNYIPSWTASKAYETAGLKVTHNNQTYTNRWWTQGNEPGQSDVWTLLP